MNRRIVVIGGTNHREIDENINNLKQYSKNTVKVSAVFGKSLECVKDVILRDFNKRRNFLVIETTIKEKDNGFLLIKELKESGFGGNIISHSMHSRKEQAKFITADHFARKNFFHEIISCVKGECDCNKLKE